MTIVILTPLRIEYESVRFHLRDLIPLRVGSYFYEKAIYNDFTIVIREAGIKNTQMSIETIHAIDYFSPNLIFLVGIAGGVKDVVKGDVVVTTKVYGYESLKETDKESLARPEVVNFDLLLLSKAREIASKKDWLQRLNSPKLDSKVFFGPIAAGDKVIASTSSEVYKLIKLHYNDTIALEMEAMGFGNAILRYPMVRGLVIRSISDLLDHKSSSDLEGYQQIASNNAAAFLIELIKHISKEELKFEPMDIKPLTHEIFKAIFPLMEKEANKELVNNDSSLLVQLLSKVKGSAPLQYAELINDVGDTDLQAGLRTQLRLLMKSNGKLKDEFTALLTKVNESTQGTTTISNSKNVISNSTLNASGDIRIGDETNTIGQQINNFGSVEKQVNIDNIEGDINL